MKTCIYSLHILYVHILTYIYSLHILYVYIPTGNSHSIANLAVPYIYILMYVAHRLTSVGIYSISTLTCMNAKFSVYDINIYLITRLDQIHSTSTYWHVSNAYHTLLSADVLYIYILTYVSHSLTIVDTYSLSTYSYV